MFVKMYQYFYVCVDMCVVTLNNQVLCTVNFITKCNYAEIFNIDLYIVARACVLSVIFITFTCYLCTLNQSDYFHYLPSSKSLSL
ncbi:hypothetical protein BDF19DRAFT_435270 [Syncephalis fuscata]|nr:hypothetical protein BDF19DRAFT_435270 [Syncephalis fuscata]